MQGRVLTGFLEPVRPQKKKRRNVLKKRLNIVFFKNNLLKVLYLSVKILLLSRFKTIKI